LSLPSDIRLQITPRCNHHCHHCFSSSNDGIAIKELSDSEFLSLIDQVVHEELRAISITGGEPLVRLNLVFKILERLQAYAITKTLNTNGWFMSLPTAIRLKEAGLNIVQISLDSSVEEKHDSFREMRGSYERALNAVESSANAGLETHVRTTITSFNYDEMPSILELTLKKGAHRLVVKPLILSGRGSHYCKPLSPDQHKRAVRDLINQIRSNPNLTLNHVQFLTPCFPFLVDQEYVQYVEACECGDNLAFIASNGDVQPCGYAHLILGNILETSLEKIWSHSPYLLEWREKRLNGKCLVCEFGKLCQGGCRAAAYETTGNMMSLDPSCWLEESK
jgi:radical SAM protein with 4Fe4S-binding SPASM domain